MMLYHGTSAEALESILRNGIQPRAESKVSSHWRDCPSAPDRVYLAEGYAPYFALQASGDFGAILEVDVDELQRRGAGEMLPDEDWLDQSTRKITERCWWQDADDWPKVESMRRTTRWFRDHAREFGALWRESLRGLGTCSCAGVVPVSAIKRVTVLEWEQVPEILVTASDPSITLLNHRLVGGKYRALTDQCFSLGRTEALTGTWRDCSGVITRDGAGWTVQILRNGQQIGAGSI